jgi:hypothetical protein
MSIYPTPARARRARSEHLHGNFMPLKGALPMRPEPKVGDRQPSRCIDNVNTRGNIAAIEI